MKILQTLQIALGHFSREFSSIVKNFHNTLFLLEAFWGVAVDLRLLRFASKPFFFFFFKVECLRGGSGKWGKHCLSNYG